MNRVSSLRIIRYLKKCDWVLDTSGIIPKFSDYDNKTTSQKRDLKMQIDLFFACYLGFG